MIQALSLPPLHYIQQVRTAKQAAAVNTTPNGPIRKGEVMGKCQSAVPVERHQD